MPISLEAAHELTSLNQIIIDIQGNQHGRDKWTYIWSSTKHTSNKFDSLNFASIVAPTPFKWIWKSKVLKTIKIFIRLLFRDRINSKNLLRRKKLQNRWG
jgi:hypothetical protein